MVILTLYFPCTYGSDLSQFLRLNLESAQLIFYVLGKCLDNTVRNGWKG